MANKKTPSGISEYLAQIGRKGGQATGRKGFAAMSEEQRKEIVAKGLATRRANAKKKAEPGKKAVAKKAK
jgi:general stress protein YciG